MNVFWHFQNNLNVPIFEVNFACFFSEVILKKWGHVKCTILQENLRNLRAFQKIVKLVLKF